MMVTLRGRTISLLFLLLMLQPMKLHSHANPIKTVVVLVMENRSFDHLLGWLKHLKPEIDGPDGTHFNLLDACNPKSEKVFFGNHSHFVAQNPSHSLDAVTKQIFGCEKTYQSQATPPMSGFAQQAFSDDPSMNLTKDVMNGFHPDLLPSYMALASEFAICDRWFSSVPSETQPNRLYVHSATSAGTIDNDPGIIISGYPQRTIFDNLADAGISWGVYYQEIPMALFYKNLRMIKYTNNFLPYESHFKEHAKAGKLPAYVVVEQIYTDTAARPANDDHPPHDVYYGQLLVKEVYETLRASPQWNETLLVITYDEHGGFYDHVPTPTRGVPSPDGIVGPKPSYFKFDRLGVRVPTFLVSPWINKGTVLHGPNGSPFPTSEFEHSSIPATVKKLFNLPNYLTMRDRWAGTFESLFHARTEPRTDCPEKLPPPRRTRAMELEEDTKLRRLQSDLVQLAAALNGDHLLTRYPGNIAMEMPVKGRKEYMEDAVNRFFQAGRDALEMGMEGDHIVQMRPSLTTRSQKRSQPKQGKSQVTRGRSP